MKVEYGIIAVLSIVLLYYVYSHHYLIGDLMLVPHDNNPQLKAVKDKHIVGGLIVAGVGVAISALIAQR